MDLLKNKIALVLGGTAHDGQSSIGAALCRFLKEEGALVIPSSSNKAKVEKTIEVLQTSPGIESDILAFDVANSDSLKRCIDSVIEKHGRIDILVNCQGMSIKKRTADMPNEDWLRMVEVNFLSVSDACRQVAKHMIKAGSGHIINISSVLSLNSVPYAAAYCSTKYGVKGLTENFACEWARDNISVNAIAPGWFVTDLNRESLENDMERRDKIVKASPALRLGSPDFEDLRAPLIFLSTCTNYINGLTVPVDGGTSFTVYT